MVAAGAGGIAGTGTAAVATRGTTARRTTDTDRRSGSTLGVVVTGVVIATGVDTVIEGTVAGRG
jgi:hypothetical protein